MSAVDYRAERYATDEGFAVGEIIGSGEYLTILGSHWETIPLFGSAGLAQAWHDQRFEKPVGEWFKPVCVKVRRISQSIFRVIA